MVYDRQSKSSSWKPKPRKSSFFPPSHIQTKTEAKNGSDLVGKLPSKEKRDQIRRSLFGDIPEMTGAKAETAPQEAQAVQNPTQVSEEAASGEIQAKQETGLTQPLGYGFPSREVRNKIRRRMFGNLELTPVSKLGEEVTSTPTPLQQAEGIQEQAGGEDKGLAETEITRPIQAKLTIGEPNDVYEKEADRVAAAVVDQIHSPLTKTVGEQQAVQRMEEEENLQMKPMVQRVSAEGGEVSAEFERELNAARGGGQSLAPDLQVKMEQAMGADFNGVRVHTDGRADALNRSVGARAFTTGQDLFFKRGEYQPGSWGGQELIAHELTHVIQQGEGGNERAGLQRLQTEAAKHRIQRSKLKTDQLNMAGENHEESNTRRDREKEFTAATTKSEKYWEEHEFTVRDKRWNDLWNGKPAKGDPERYAVLQGLIAVKFYTENDLPQLIKFLLEKKDLDKYLPLWKKLHYALEGNIATMIYHVKSLDRSEEKRQLTKIQKEALNKLKEQNETLRELWIQVKRWITEEYHKGIIEDSQKLLKILRQTIEYAKTLSQIENKGEEKEKEENKNLGDRVQYLRSVEMYKAAKNSKYTKGVWKVGDKHIMDLIDPEGGYLKEEEKNAKINIIKKDDFNKEYQEYIEGESENSGDTEKGRGWEEKRESGKSRYKEKGKEKE